MNFKRDQIEELIQYLQGTCNSLDEGIVEVLGEDYDSMNLSSDNHNQIDNEIFLCETCGWWYELCEESENEDERTCESCAEY